MPAVSLVIAITLGAFALQIERMKLVDISATAARAFSRGESEESIRALVAKLLNAQNFIAEFKIEEDYGCVEISKVVTLPALGARVFELSESSCGRKAGL